MELVEQLEDELLEDHEVQKLVEATLDENRETTEENITKFLHWCHGVKMDYLLVKLAIEGKINVRIKGDNSDEWLWGLTEKEIEK